MSPDKQKNKPNKTNGSSKTLLIIKAIVSWLIEFLQEYYLAAFVVILIIAIVSGELMSRDGVVVIIIIVGFGLLYFLKKWLNKE